RPALARLLHLGRQRDCRVLLTGEGADEWLGVYHSLSADLLRSLDLGGVYRLWRTFARSYPFTRWNELRRTLWDFGARLLLRDVVGKSALLESLRRRRQQRRDAALPWIAPAGELRAEMGRRFEESREREAAMPRAKSYYLRETRLLLDVPQKWMALEE